MTTGLGKSYSFGLLCAFLVKVYQFVCVCFFSFGFEDVMWDLIVFIPDHCLSYLLFRNSVGSHMVRLCNKFELTVIITGSEIRLLAVLMLT